MADDDFVHTPADVCPSCKMDGYRLPEGWEEDGWRVPQREGLLSVSYWLDLKGYKSSRRQTLVGQRVPDLPPIPYFEVRGEWFCPVCEVSQPARVCFRRGVIVFVDLLESLREDPLVGLPKNPQKKARRDAVAEERERRRLAEMKEIRAQYSTSSLAASLLAPFSDCIDYASFGRRVFLLQGPGYKEVGPYKYTPERGWERKPGTQLG
jgi:hypothetical protein